MNRKSNPWVALTALILLAVILVTICAGCGVPTAAAEATEPDRFTVERGGTDVRVITDNTTGAEYLAYITAYGAGLAPLTASPETTETSETTWKSPVSTIVVAHPQTPKVAQPVGYQMGDPAWIVMHKNDACPAMVQPTVVIAEIEGYLITAPQYCGSIANSDFMWDLVLRSDDGRQCLDIWPIGDCYTDRETALAVVDQENATDWYQEG